jgi:aspartate/methionine/tyrosine aminotransferase
MKLPPFLLDQWLQQKFSANPPIEFDLGSSTGPTWTLRELLALGSDIEELLATNLFYTPPDGSAALREELARMHGVEPERVLVMTGASEALLSAVEGLGGVSGSCKGGAAAGDCLGSPLSNCGSLY